MSLLRKSLKIPYRIIDRIVQRLLPDYKKFRKYEQELQHWKNVWPERMGEPDIVNGRYITALGVGKYYFESKRILDVGCGPLGAVCGFDVCEKHGIDSLINQYVAIGYPLYNHQVKYLNSYSENMPYPDSYFGAVISVNALDHVDDFPKTAQEMQRVLKSGGEIIFQTEYHKPWKTEPVELNDEIILSNFDKCEMKKVISYFGDTGKYKKVEYVTWRGEKC